MSATPHDHYFKYVFSQTASAASLLRQWLPEPVARHLAFDSLQLVSGDSVDDALSARHADLLFEARLAGRPALLYLLLEHQSSVEPLMPLRSLAYALPVWVRHARKPGLPLPPVIPCVLYHGIAEWNAATAFEDMVEFGCEPELSPTLRRFTPHFDLHLLDLGKIEGPDLDLDVPLAAIAVNLLKEVPRRNDLDVVLSAQSANLRRLIADRDRGALEASFSYIAQANPRADLEAVQRVLLFEVGAVAQELSVSTFQQLFDEHKALGRQEGRQEGLLLGQQRTLVKQLRFKFREQVTAELEARVQQGTSDDLDRWSERLLTAGTLEAVFAAGEA